MILRNSLLVVGTLALLSGITLSGLWLRQQAMPVRIASQQEPERLSMLAAARPIATGTLLRPEDLTWKDVQPGEI